MVEKGRNATLLVITSGVVSCPCLLKGKQTVAWRGQDRTQSIQKRLKLRKNQDSTNGF
jgi:hypothetical protein